MVWFLNWNFQFKLGPLKISFVFGGPREAKTAGAEVVIVDDDDDSEGCTSGTGRNLALIQKVAPAVTHQSGVKKQILKTCQNDRRNDAMADFGFGRSAVCLNKCADFGCVELQAMYDGLTRGQKNHLRRLTREFAADNSDDTMGMTADK